MALQLPNSRPTLLMLAPFFLWGTAMVAMKGTLPHTAPFFLATVRLLPAGALVLLAGLWQGRSQPQGWGTWAWIVGFGLLDGTLFQGFLAQGLSRTTAGLGSVMIDSQPLAVALLAHWIFGEYVGPIGWLGLAIGIVGIALLGLPESLLDGAVDWGMAALHQPIELADWDWTALQANLLALIAALPGPIALLHNGQVLMLLAALSMAGGTIVSRIVSDRADTVNATGWHMIIGSLPLLALSWGQEVEPWAALTLRDWSALAYSTVFGSAIAYALFFYFASTGSITSLSSLTFLTPVFAILFGNLFLAEQLTGLQWVGVGLTLVSIYLINQRGQAVDPDNLADGADEIESIGPVAPKAEISSKP
jgi:drug/metabolite transporter (DMT)-like permease